MELTLSVGSRELTDEGLQELTRGLCRTLNREADVQARLAEEPAEAGSRGDPVTVGTIALTFLTSGAALGLLKVFEVYFARKPSLEIEIEHPTKGKRRIRAEDLSSKETKELTESFLRD